jgi:hypothetical protein
MLSTLSCLLSDRSSVMEKSNTLCWKKIFLIWKFLHYFSSTAQRTCC